MITRSLGYGKVVLFGEYGVLSGGRALVFATKNGAWAQYEPSSFHDDSLVDQNTYLIDAFSLGQARLYRDEFGVWQTDGDSFPFVKEALLHRQAPFGRYSINSQDCQIQTTQGPRKIGLGSSAAVVVSLLTLFSVDSIDQLFKETVQIHKKVQMGVGSGVDVMASIMGGVISYSFEKRQDAQGDELRYHVSRIKPFRKQILCVWTGQSASTTALIGQIRSTLSQRDYDLHLNRLSMIAQEAFDRMINPAFKSEDWFEMVRAGRKAIQDLGKASGACLWLDTHEQIHLVVEKMGGVCKSTGAAGGDLAWVLGEDEAHERMMAEVLGGQGFDCYFLEMGGERF